MMECSCTPGVVGEVDDAEEERPGPVEDRLHIASSCHVNLSLHHSEEALTKLTLQHLLIL